MNDTINMSLSAEEMHYILECIAIAAQHHKETANIALKKDDMNGYQIAKNEGTKAWCFYKKLANTAFGLFKGV